MAQYLVGVGASLVLLIFVIEMLRRGIVAEKFAALWLIVTLGLVGFAVFPGVLRWLAESLGFALPSNLLFALAGLLLLAVSVQLSHEVGRLDVQSRRLAQELALLRHEVQGLQSGRVSSGPDSVPAPPAEPGPEIDEARPGDAS